MRSTLPIHAWLLLLLAGLCLFVEPALAGNKFETISHGVSGSRTLKLGHLALVMFAVGGVFFFGAVLAVLVPHRNPLFLNYATWKQSAAMLLVLGAAAVAAGLALR